MKKGFLLVFIVFLGYSGLSQDLSSYANFLLRPYFENGVSLVRNDFMKQNYEIQPIDWGIGLQFGLPELQRLIPYAQYTNSEYKLEQKGSNTISNNQFSGGVIIPLKTQGDFVFKSKVGYNYSKIKESSNDINSGSHGFKLGIGFEKKLFMNSRVYTDLVYNYQKTRNNEFKDFDSVRLSIGFIL
ncbi:MAG: hypothetical protein MI739_11470 [Bacteroidales bacterium]|nr:hypothetical protein [Bacteroidales bacterium]